MLVVSPLRNSRDESEREMESFSIGGNEFPDFSSVNLLDSIDFDDLFIGIDDGDVLPDLEMDSEILAEFSAGEESEMNSSVSIEKAPLESNSKSRKDEEDKVLGGSGCSSKRDESVTNSKPSRKKSDKARKSSAQSKNPQVKRKVKVDWTPELHKRFEEAVEHLGLDKAVPSRILELMGIDCLTRHNIASHLQKYRSHRKHLLAREAEAASWSQKRQIYGCTTAGSGRKNKNPWFAPTIGFPPMTPLLQHFRPLHVWGHPSVDQSLMHMWPKHLVPSPFPSPPPLLPPPDPSFLHSHYQRVTNSLTSGTPYFPPPVATTRFPAPLVPGIPSPHDIGVPTRQTGPHPPFNFEPSKESIDAAIEDIISKPRLPLPLGLKPPSLDSVLVELQRQGIPNIPPTCV